MNNTIKEKKCWVCDQNISPFMSFGRMPLANNFLRKEDFKDEYFFEMETAFCNKCKSFQLINQPEPEKMFHDNYAFFSGTSVLMDQHFKKFSESVFQYIDQDSFVVEIGSNDGIMLKNFAEKEIKHLGIEPSSNVAAVASSRGINTMVSFFNKELAEQIVKENGKANAFIAANVMCHIPYINSIIEGIATLLDEDGIVIFEDPYLGDVIEKTTYDQIYDEHTFLFSAHSVKNLISKYDMELIDVEHQETHGGSMRYFLSRKNTRPATKRVEEILVNENKLGLTNHNTFIQFKENCERYRNNLLEVLKNIKKEGKSIAGYAATSKSTTITNYCDINTDLIDCIYDTTPLKQGKFSPGTHIPIVPHEEFRDNYPDYVLLFGYNHSKEIFAKEKEFEEKGGKWIIYVPEIRVIG